MSFGRDYLECFRDFFLVLFFLRLFLLFLFLPPLIGLSALTGDMTLDSTTGVACPTGVASTTGLASASGTASATGISAGGCDGKVPALSAFCIIISKCNRNQCT
mgnify:CR=1 FL=1